LGLIENWLRNIRDIYRLHQEELDNCEKDKRARKLVELNVKEQVFNLYKISFVQHSIKTKGIFLLKKGYL
jgi:carbonic anhydrase